MFVKILLAGFVYACTCWYLYRKPGYQGEDFLESTVGCVVYGAAVQIVQKRLWLHMAIPTIILAICVAVASFKYGLIAFLICVNNWILNRGDSGSGPAVVYAISLLFMMFNVFTIRNGDIEFLSLLSWPGIYWSVSKLRSTSWLQEEALKLLEENKDIIQEYRHIIDTLLTE